MQYHFLQLHYVSHFVGCYHHELKFMATKK